MMGRRYARRFASELPLVRDLTRLALSLAVALFPASSTAEVDYSGTYAFILQTRSITKLPIVKDYVATSRSVALVELKYGEGRLRGRGPVCSIELLGSSALAKMELPDAFRRALPPVQVDAVLSRKGERTVFEQGAQTVVVGAKLRDPIREALPEDAEDERVFDQDRDGKPGVTVRVHGLASGEVFVVQRSTSRLRGSQKGKGFSGQVLFTNEQKVLGASSPFLKGNRPSTPSPEGSWFRLDPLRPGSGCREALARASAAWPAD